MCMCNILSIIEESTADLCMVCCSNGLCVIKTVLDSINMQWCMHKGTGEFDQHVADLEQLHAMLDKFKMSCRLQLPHSFNTVLKDAKAQMPLKP